MTALGRESLGAFFARELRHWPDRERWIAVVDVYEAYCDHSYTGGGPTKALTLACLVCPLDRWVRFSAAWDAAMKNGGAEGKILHMRRLVHGLKEWAGWNDVKRQTPLFEQLVTVCREHLAWGMTVSLPYRDWEEFDMLPKAPKNPAEEPFITPLMLAFHIVLAAMHRDLRPTPEKPIHCYMEQDHLVEADVTTQYYYMTGVRGWAREFPLIRPLGKGPQPLQAADMLAYEQSRYCSEQRLSESPDKNPRRLFLELAQLSQINCAILERDALIEHVRNVRLSEERAARDPEWNEKLDRGLRDALKRMHRDRDPKQSR